MSSNPLISIILPACNESAGLKHFLPQLMQAYPLPAYEILIIDDGSTDDTADFAHACGAKVISHPYKIGNGAAIKTGARAALGQYFIFMDADAQHNIEDIQTLIRYSAQYDMVVGARKQSDQANFIRYIGNRFYNYLASYLVNQPVLDLTSGFRLVNAAYCKQFLYLLPNQFSYPSTLTMAFFRSGYSVKYCDITVAKRIGKSHLHPLSDGLRFLLIIYKITTLYSPLKVFLPFALLNLIAGLSNYAYTYISQGRFTNMSATLLSTAIIIFLMGLISEQITNLMYQPKN